MNNDHTNTEADDLALSITEFATIVNEAISQPPWRLNADHEADYADGNQLSTDLMLKQKQLGIPPAKENIIGPAIEAVCGYEAKTRTDWRVTPDGDPAGQDMADAVNYKMNQAERHSKADRAMSKAFKPQVSVGLGWVEVARAPNSLMFSIQSRYVHRNEVWWDMKDMEPSLPTARWLYRRRWVHRSKAAQQFPKHKDVILTSMEQWVGESAGQMLEGGQSTGLLAAAEAQRAWTNMEDAWFNSENQSVCITEIWYRRWLPTLILKMPNGRAVEYDEDNALHQAAVMSGRGKLIEELIPRMRMGYWMGPICLHDGPTPYPHDKFPYVPFFGYTEDMTGIPYGLVRDMLFPQDNLNSSISKLRWGMSSVRTERTKGAVAMSDEKFRQTIATANADIVLDPQHMAQPGARFEVKRDFQLNDQQFTLMNDSRAAIGRMGVSNSFQGKEGNATSGIQEQTQVEQSQVSLAALMDSFKDSRTCVGEIMMALVMEDLGSEEQTIVIEGDAINESRTVVINKPEIDPETEMPYLSNDIQRARLLVALEDVPSSSSFRAQQLYALTESSKSAPPNLQEVMAPFMIDLMDLPRKKEIVQAIRESKQQADPKQMREQIKQELMIELKSRELDLKYSPEKLRAEIAKIVSETVESGVRSSFSAMQAAQTVAQLPMVAPIADVLLQNAGWQAPTPSGMDPEIPQPEVAMPVQPDMAAPGDTSPQTPVDPMSAAQGVNQGINTMREDSRQA